MLVYKLEGFREKDARRRGIRVSLEKSIPTEWLGEVVRAVPRGREDVVGRRFLGEQEITTR